MFFKDFCESDVLRRGTVESGCLIPKLFQNPSQIDQNSSDNRRKVEVERPRRKKFDLGRQKPSKKVGFEMDSGVHLAFPEEFPATMPLPPLFGHAKIYGGGASPY